VPSTSTFAPSAVLLGGILVSLATNLVYPGEVFFQSKFLFIIVSILAFLTAFILQHRSENSGRIIRQIGIVFVLLLFLLPSTLRTINASRSQDVFLLFFAYACLFATLQLIRVEFASLLLSLLFLVIVAFCIDLFSLYQYFFGLSELKALVLNSTALDEKLKSGVLTRITTRRVFANFPLPNTLAGFVAMVLPLNVFLLCPVLGSVNLLVGKYDRFLSVLFQSRLTSFLLIVQLCLSLLVLALTQSFGGWVCFCAAFALLGLWGIVRSKIPMRLTVAVLLVVLATSTGWLAWVTYQRGFSLWNIEASENPIALRLNNYRTALHIFHDFPGTGVGLGNYGSIDPRYQGSPATVAQYAHNTLLQLLSEAGTPFLVLLLLISIAVSKHWRDLLGRILPDSGMQGFLKVCLEASLVAWLIHNLLDIDLYFPSLGSLGVFLLGILAGNLRTRKEETGPVSALSKRSLMPVTIVLGATFLAAFFVVRNYLAESLCSLAVDYGEAKNFEQAQHFMDKAVAIQGNDAIKVILQAKFAYLNANQKRQAGLAQLLVLREAYERATRLDVFNANYHHELSRILFALGETKWAQSRDRAIELFPSESKFRQNAPGP
jgi:O-antigen ligase